MAELMMATCTFNKQMIEGRAEFPGEQYKQLSTVQKTHLNMASSMQCDRWHPLFRKGLITARTKHYRQTRVWISP